MLPQILNAEITITDEFPLLDQREKDYIEEAKGLFQSEFYSYSLLAIWNAAVNNLKRKVESYGIELWSSVIKDEPGRKKYDKDGESIAERWSNVDDLILIKGATRLGLLNPKAGKSLEMINWMRNHASPAHDSDNRVEKEDAIGLILLLQKNLFEQPFPDPGHSISAIFDPIKNTELSEEEITILCDQINSFKKNDIRTSFGFFTDLIAEGVEPAFSNASDLFSTLWEVSSDDLKKTLGLKYHTYILDPDSDESSDQGAKTRIFELLARINGIHYIPDGTRARIFRRAADKLKIAKDSTYGWSKEESASLNLNQMGTSVPSVAFEEVYQELIAVWCGNYWGRSSSHGYLTPFFENIGTDKLRQILKMFRENERVTEELFQKKPKKEAIELLNSFHDRFTLEAHKQELKETIEFVKEM